MATRPTTNCQKAYTNKLPTVTRPIPKSHLAYTPIATRSTPQQASGLCVGLMPIGCQLGVGLVAIGSYRVGLMETSVGLGSTVGLVERNRVGPIGLSVTDIFYGTVSNIR